MSFSEKFAQQVAKLNSREQLGNYAVTGAGSDCRGNKYSYVNSREFTDDVVDNIHV